MMETGQVLAGLGSEVVRQLLPIGQLPEIPREVDLLEDEIERWEHRLQDLELESVFPEWRFVALGIGVLVGAGLGIWVRR